MKSLISSHFVDGFSFCYFSYKQIFFNFFFFKWQNGGYGFPCVGSYCILCAWKVYWWKRKHVRKLKNIYTHHLLSFPIILQKPWSLRDYFEDADFKKCHELQKKIFNASKLIACQHHNSSASLCVAFANIKYHVGFVALSMTCFPLRRRAYQRPKSHYISRCTKHKVLTEVHGMESVTVQSLRQKNTLRISTVVPHCHTLH